MANTIGFDKYYKYKGDIEWSVPNAPDLIKVEDVKVKDNNEAITDNNGNLVSTENTEANKSEIIKSIEGAKRKNAKPSIFNRYSIFSINTISNANNETDGLLDVNRLELDESLRKVRNKPTARNIINWSTSGNTNAVEYALEDFLWCKNYGRIPNNYMITLRRFPEPIGDNIFDYEKYPSPDISRMITWLDGEDNNWESVGLHWEHGVNWKDLEADIQLVDTSMAQSGTEGNVSWGEIAAKRWLDSNAAKSGIANPNLTGSDVGYSNSSVVYGPIDVINKTTIREKGVNFTQNINLVFNYKLKSVDGINPKAAFIDLLSNILIMSSNRAPFWGGDVRYYGSNPRKISPFGDKRHLMKGGTKGVLDYFRSVTNAMQQAIKNIMGDGNFISGLQNIGKTLLDNGMSQLASSMLDDLGRPNPIAINSLLTGDDTGFWHLMVGNPANPIISIGNLILKNTKIEFGGPLGIDDFPTELKVICELAPGRPRDRIDIMSMFHRNNRTYLTTLPDKDIKYVGNVKLKKNGGNIPSGSSPSMEQTSKLLQRNKQFINDNSDSDIDIQSRFPNHTNAKNGVSKDGMQNNRTTSALQIF